MAVYRVHKNSDFTTISNYHLKDKNLSLMAKGLLTVMLSLPNDWNYTEKGLTSLSTDGIGNIKKAIKELQANHYLVRSRERTKEGKLGGAVYDVYELPCGDAVSVPLF